MLIVIEGCVGVGKTTVAKGLAEIRGSRLLLEDFESNPFLRDFYEDPVEHATETEFAFLLLHFHQLKGQVEVASRSELVADFHLGKDLLYADLNLKDSRELRLFKELYQLCVEKTPHLGLMIFLSASTDLVVKRIRERKREFELEIDPRYYAAVTAAYERFFDLYPGRKLRVPMDTWDFVKEPALYKRLDSLVEGELNISE
jgi:deoxyguanosine kinase